MKKINLKNKVLAILIAMSLLPISPAWAVQSQQSGAGDGRKTAVWLQNMWEGVSGIRLEADVRLFGQKTPSKDEDGESEDESVLKARDIHVKGGITLTQAMEYTVKLAFRVDLARIAGLDDKDAKDPDKLEEAIERAEIIVTSTSDGSLVRTIRFGKGETALREFVESNKLYKDNLLYKISHKDEVMGISVELSPEVLNGVAIELALNECQEGDFNINNDELNDGCRMFSAAVRDIQLTDYLTFAAEYLNENPDQEGVDSSQTIKMYAAVESEGFGKGYISLLLLDNNKIHPDADIAATIGYEKAFGPGQFVIQYEHLNLDDQDSQSQVNVSYNIDLGTVVISPYVTHKDKGDSDEDEDRETVVGVNFHLTLGKHYRPMN